MNCLDCGHAPEQHADTGLALCEHPVCPCVGLHLDVGDCVPGCYEVDYRSCDVCGKVESHDDCSMFDWVNGVCEDCDPDIVFADENAWRILGFDSERDYLNACNTGCVCSELQDELVATPDLIASNTTGRATSARGVDNHPPPATLRVRQRKGCKMGYYVRYEGTITVPPAKHDNILEALKNLNHRHDLKHGGAFGANVSPDPYESRWFSWMPPRYHEQVESVWDVLELLGFDGTPNESGVYEVYYDSKTGDEDLFLEELVRNGGEVDLYATGEDDHHWHLISEDGQLRSRTGRVVYD